MADQDTTDDTSGSRLSTREAADRLGVKPETVYAYVSRGQLASRREPGGRGSTFDAKEVDALARRGSRREPSGSGGELTVRTGITLIERDHCYFRGVDTSELAAHYGYEEVAEWLWTGEMRRDIRFTAPAEALAAARRAVQALPEHSGPMDRLRVAVIAAAAADPLRFDLSEDTVLDTARSLIPTLVDALPSRTNAEPDDESLAPRLWSHLTTAPADAAALRVLDAALVLLIDHDLAASTLAVRVAASARAHPYAIVSAGFGALDGALHGAASGLAHRMLHEVLERGSAAAVVADHLRAGRRVPGLGHRLYPEEDPRARCALHAAGGRAGGSSGAGCRSPGDRHYGPTHGAACQRRPRAGSTHRVGGDACRGWRDGFRHRPYGRLDRPRLGGVRRTPPADASQRAIPGTPPTPALAVTQTTSLSPARDAWLLCADSRPSAPDATS